MKLGARLKQKYDLVKVQGPLLKLYERQDRGKFKLIKCKSISEFTAKKLKKEMIYNVKN